MQYNVTDLLTNDQCMDLPVKCYKTSCKN